MKVFKENNIQSLEGAQLVLNFLWGVHSNTMSNAFFALSFLLVNRDDLVQVRAEIDSAVEKFGNLEALLQADPDNLDDPSFRLLTSAIMETMRLTGLHAGVRQASCDFDLDLKDGTTISVKKGEYMFGNVHAAHTDATVFPKPETFVVDRFAQEPYRRKHLQTDGYLFHSLGGGRHVVSTVTSQPLRRAQADMIPQCKGRWLAIYEIKVLLIILLHMFDFSPQVELRVPRVHPRSIGVIHTDDDVFVQLCLRSAEGRL